MPHRQFVDSSGHSWAVWDVVPSRVSLEELSRGETLASPPGALSARTRARLPGDYAQGWLAFQRDGERRRLAPLPPDWEALDAGDLESLCQRAVVVPPRAPHGQRSGFTTGDD